MIEDGGSQGILGTQFSKIINQPMKKVNEILKSMERRGAIKKVKSVSKGNKIVWLLAGVEPGQEVTGGLTGTDSFDLNRI